MGHGSTDWKGVMAVLMGRGEIAILMERGDMAVLMGRVKWLY